MEKRTENLLKVGLLLMAGTAVVCDKKAVKIGAGAIALAGLSYFGIKAFKKDLEEVNKECDETEEALSRSGVNPETLKSNSLLEQEDKDENDNVVFTKSLFRQSMESFDDDTVSSGFGFNEHVIHVLQKGKKLVLAFQMPKFKKQEPQVVGKHTVVINSLTGFAMYKFFKEELQDLALEEDLSLNPREIDFYQKGFAKTVKDGYVYLDEIPKLSDEKTNEYVKRINSLMETWETVPGWRDSQIKEYEAKGETLKGFENFMFVEFPVRREGDQLPGMTVLKSMWLLHELMETEYEIPMNSQGTIKKFDFHRIMFHPGYDLTEFYIWDGDSHTIEVTDL